MRKNVQGGSKSKRAKPTGLPRVTISCAAKGCVSVHSAQMFAERIAGEVQEVGFEVPDGAIHLDRFMHEFADPAGFAAVEEANLAVGIPAAMQDPAAQILRQARHGVADVCRAALLDMPDFGFQRLAQAFIGVKGQNPIVGRQFRGDVLLRGVTVPGRFFHARAELAGDFHGAIVRTAVENQNFVAAAQALNHARDVAFLVKGDDRGGDLHTLNARRHQRCGDHENNQRGRGQPAPFGINRFVVEHERMTAAEKNMTAAQIHHGK